MRQVQVQIGTRCGPDDDTTPIVVVIGDDGDAHPEWAETTARIAREAAVAAFRGVLEAVADDEADTGP